MQDESSVSIKTMEKFNSECPFCQVNAIAQLVMKQTPNFRLVADHAPLIEGHLLIIPKQHYTCYGDVPAALDDELFEIKQEVERFFKLTYVNPVYWEHGIFHQTVFHAHLHCFPIGPLTYANKQPGRGQLVDRQEKIRDWHQEKGEYFYLGDSQHGWIFPPEADDYNFIVKNELGPMVTAHSTYKQWRLSQERQIEGKPLIASVMHKWQEFQQNR
ncbi:hypothetical protein KDA_01570 [Dictyobacter alpinus]|uniref:HIT domain-containing protein n=1 Tax=Dictyobacter alpinus TaxID=2014873 RepID=A0A402B000_9CHLR|nr:HIT family protein [Dictyobacter alpinus]GCE24673.1 hypothetical protein KDA_01570 [Dictyobacter alpinus]